MKNKFYGKIRKGGKFFGNMSSKMVVRVWNLAKRFDPKTMKRQKKKKGFSKSGNKGK